MSATMVYYHFMLPWFLVVGRTIYLSHDSPASLRTASFVFISLTPTFVSRGSVPLTTVAWITVDFDLCYINQLLPSERLELELRDSNLI